jgi:hypothetical protein
VPSLAGGLGEQLAHPLSRGVGVVEDDQVEAHRRILR